MADLTLKLYKDCWVEVFSNQDNTYTAIIDTPDQGGCVVLEAASSFKQAMELAEKWIDQKEGKFD